MPITIPSLADIANMLYPGMAQSSTPAPEADPSTTLPAAAAEKYGFLKNHQVKTITNLKDNEGYAETWPADEPGDEKWPRPKDLPMGTAGVEIKRKDFSADDYAAEVFSHIDPKGVDYANQLVKSLSADQKAELKVQSKDYEMSKQQGMSENDSIRNAGMAALRGYVFNQWPKEAIDSLKLSATQKKMLDKAKQYATSGKEGN